MLEWVDPKLTPKRVKPFSVSSKNLYINNNDRTAHFVGHSKLTPLDLVDFNNNKQINENMEAEMKEMDEKLSSSEKSFFLVFHPFVARSKIGRATKDIL